MEVWIVWRKLEFYYDDNGKSLEDIFESEEKAQEYIDGFIIDNDSYFIERKVVQ